MKTFLLALGLAVVLINVAAWCADPAQMSAKMACLMGAGR